MKRLSVLLLICLMCLTGCAGESRQVPEVTDSPPVVASAPVPSVNPTTDPDAGLTGVNPLTGLKMDNTYENRRPVAIMMNNLKKALPQYGVSQADIIYEAPAEGGITRMLAVWQNPSPVERIGSVRSTRAYYLDLAQGLDAILLHAGGSPEAYAQIPARGVTALDCVRGGWEGTLYWRDKDRIKTAGYEHSVFTSGERIVQALAKVKRTEHASGYDNALRFSDDPVTNSGEAAQTITLKYSEYKTGVFSYDEKTGLYAVSEYGKAYIDGENETQVAVRNVLIVSAAVSQIKGDDAGRLRVDLVGSGSGTYACAGKAVPIKWSKKSYSAPFVYTLENGEALTLARGTSYINIFPASRSPVIG